MKKTMIFLITLVFIFTLFNFQVIRGETSLSSMFRGNPARTGRESLEGPKSNGLKWEHRLDSHIFASPVFNDKGVVFSASTDGILSGFEPQKGGTVFSVSLGKNIFSTPVIYNGYIYIAGGNPSYLYKFNLSSATKKWKIPINAEVHCSPLIANNTLYVGTDSGFFYAKDLSNDVAKMEWKYNIGVPIYSSPAYSAGKIIFGADNSYLYCLSDSGKLLWKTSLGDKVRATPLISGNYIYVGSTNGDFYKLTLGGDIVSKFKTNGAIYSSAGLLSDGSLAFGSYDGFLYILSDSLELFNKFNAGSKIYSSPCVASDDTIYFGTLDGVLYAVDSKCNELFEFDARASIYSSPVIGTDGTLYFGDDNGWTYAIGSQTGIITVYTNLDEAEYLIEGPKHYYGKGKTYVVRNAPEGTYTITYKDVPGYKTPSSETLILKGNSSIHFEATYQKAIPILSAIVVTTNLDEATFTITGPKTFSGSGKEYTVKNVPAGTYTVAFGNVKGYTTPNSVEKEVKEGEIVTFTGQYTKLPEPKTIEIVLQIGNPYMIVNGVTKEVDPGRGTAPAIIPKWNRTVVPVRAIIESLGGKILWDGKERKVTILFNDNAINLWISKNSAEVNGKYHLIDSGNPNVTPIIINNRTMVPVRFVVESIGCTVKWDPDTKKITIIYVEPLGL